MTKYNPLTGHNYPTDGAYLRAKTEAARARRIAKKRAVYSTVAAFFALCVYLIFT
jgi:beta-xylosidase